MHLNVCLHCVPFKCLAWHAVDTEWTVRSLWWMFSRRIIVPCRSQPYAVCVSPMCMCHPPSYDRTDLWSRLFSPGLQLVFSCLWLGCPWFPVRPLSVDLHTVNFSLCNAHIIIPNKSTQRRVVPASARGWWRLETVCARQWRTKTQADVCSLAGSPDHCLNSMMKDSDYSSFLGHLKLISSISSQSNMTLLGYFWDHFY